MAKLLGVMILLRLERCRLQVINFALLAGLPEPDVVSQGTAILVVPDIFGSSISAGTACCLFTVFTATGIFVTRKQSNRVVTSLSFFFITLGGFMLLSLKGINDPEVVMFDISAILRARIVYVCVLALIILSVLSRDSIYFVVSMSMLFLLLKRSSLTFLVVIVSLKLFLMTEYFISETNLIPSLGVLVLWALGQCAFFAFGNSHAIATVDVSGAYTGLTEYNMTICGFLCGIITFSGPVLATAHIVRFIEVKIWRANSLAVTGKLRVVRIREVNLAFWILQSVTSFRIWAISAILVAMQSHLFIWTVFAPKWMYETLFTVAVSAASQLLFTVAAGNQ